jgi:REP element-mobilizing transposase RayT
MIYEKGYYYHLYNRGCNKELIFKNENDYKKLIEMISDSELDQYLRLYAFSLMPNHYHFLTYQISDKPLSSWIKYIFNKYAKYFNKKFNRKGTLFESKVKAKGIDKLEYLITLVHYIINNPKNVINKKYSTLANLNEIQLFTSHFIKNILVQLMITINHLKNIGYREIETSL